MAVVLAFMVAVSMSATLMPTVAYADDGQTGIQTDVQGFIDKADEEYARYITKTLATQYPTVDPEKGLKYVPEGGYAYGFRNAGSDAEHQAADFLADEFDKMGLDVSKDAVTVDKWQYNGATFEMDGMQMEDGICSYASTGTNDSGVEGEIVYLGDLDETSGEGTGYEWAYEAYYDEHGLTGDDRNMNGKIVVADIHQYADNWITPYYQEAYHQGAAALITYSYQYCNEDGTQMGTKWDHCVQIQDLCSSDYKVPTVAISRCDGLKIKEQIKKAYEEGKTPTAKLTVDNVIDEDQGTSYNVVGTLKGTGNTGQRIVISGHYDKYWYGFNDDCAAIGNVFGTAKAMVDSGYKPVNDIVFIAHGAEEWGQTGTETDWATGSWGELHDAHPEWQASTLAMINFELPTITPDAMIGGDELKEGQIGSIFGCTEQVSAVLDSFADGDLLKQVNKSTGKEVVEVADRYYHAQPMSDALGWQFCGVPCYELRGYYGEMDDFSIYHTPFDDEAHYPPETMDWCIKATAALAAYIDQSPAVEFSTTKICEKLTGSIDENKALYEEANVDIQKFEKAIGDLKTAGNDYQKFAQDINKSYANAADGAKADILKLGTSLNQRGLKAFRVCQDDILVVLGDSDAATRNEAIQENYNMIQEAVSCLESEDENAAFGALDIMWGINGGIEYTTYCFSEWAAKDAIDTVTCVKIPDGSNRSCGHKVGYVETYPATYKIFHTLADEAEGLASDGFKDEIAIYKSEAAKLIPELKTAMDREQTAIETMTEWYKTDAVVQNVTDEANAAIAAAATIGKDCPAAKANAVKAAKTALETAIAGGNAAEIAAATSALNAAVKDAQKAIADIAAKTKAAKAKKTKIKAKAKKGKKALVTWNAVSGVTGYKVYRATKKNGKYKLIKTIKNAKTKKFMDKKLKKGKKYFYKVIPYTNVNGKAVNGLKSNIKKIKAK